MKVIVTGASGFVGRNLLLRVPNSWEIFGVFNSSLDFEDFVKRECGRNIIPIRCDLRSNSQIRELKKRVGEKIELALYFAANTNPVYSVEHPSSDLNSNVSALINFFENFKNKKVIYLSSLAVYEGNTGLVTVDSKLSPTLPYAISKVAAERYIKFYSKIKKRISNYIILRFFGAYGPYEPRRKIFTKLIKTFLIKGESKFKICGDGNNYLDVMCIEDAIRGIMSVVKSKTSNVTVNFGTGKPLTINEVVKRIGNVCGVGDPVILHGGEVYEYNKFYMSPRDMRNKFSFEPKISLEKGIKKFSDFLIEKKERT